MIYNSTKEINLFGAWFKQMRFQGDPGFEKKSHPDDSYRSWYVIATCCVFMQISGVVPR